MQTLRKKKITSALDLGIWLAEHPEEARPAIYLRVSTEDQAQSGLGLKDQRRRALAMVEVKGWPEPVEFTDEGISGTKGIEARPGLKAIMDAAQRKDINVVVVSELSRIGRDVRIVLRTVDDLSEAGVALVSCKESIDTTTASGKFILTVFAAMAQMERDLIADRTKGALSELGRTKGDMGGRLPFAYRRTTEGVVIQDEELAGVVRAIFQWRSMGWTLRKIAAMLDDIGVPTRLGGARWYHGTVRSILSNESAYRGGQMGSSDLKWPAILEVVA